MNLKLLNHAVYIISNYGPKEFLKRLIKVALNRFKKHIPQFLLFIFKPFVIRLLKKFSSNRIEDNVDFIYRFFFGAFKPGQIKFELEELLKIYKEIKPKFVLEIGTANGGTLFCFSRLAERDAVIISIDLPGGPFGGGYPNWKSKIYKSFGIRNQKIYLIRGDSHRLETYQMVLSILNDSKFDFIFIDGDHSYNGVKKDYELYSKLVKTGGIIAFHDIAPNGEQKLVGEVPKFWNEIKHSFKYLEILSSNEQKGYGIGLIIFDNFNHESGINF